MWVCPALFCLLLAILPGCARGPDAEYGLSRGSSVNGTKALADTFRGRGHLVRAAVRLTDELAVWSEGIVRFAPYPGPPEADEARWFLQWLDKNPRRWLIYVVRDFDTLAEYWENVRDGTSETTDPERRAEAEANRGQNKDWVHSLPATPKQVANARDWFAIESAAGPPKISTTLEGPWAEHVDARAAQLWLHESIKPDQEHSILLAANGKALVVDQSVIGRRRILVVANGSFLLNEALANPARRKLALRLAEWPADVAQQVAFVDGAFVTSGEEGPPTLWKLLKRLPDLRWVAAQMGLAALFAALARAPRLGRPRPDPASGADRPAAHARALGSLLEASGATAESRDLIERYRLWRWPHAPRVH
jgi:hypothetical protein